MVASKGTSILTDRAARGAATVDELEEQGPSAKRPEVNVDNAQLYRMLDTAVHFLPWYTHIKPAQPTKDGCRAFCLLKKNLINSSSRGIEDQQNKDTIKGLSYNGDVATWTFEKYVLSHKDCHVVQDRLADDHVYQNFDERYKVTWFTNGLSMTMGIRILMSVTKLPGSRTASRPASIPPLFYRFVATSMAHVLTLRKLVS